MSELPGSPHCPVLSCGKYISELHPDCTALRWCPQDVLLDEELQLCNAPVGKNPVGMLMKDMSDAAKLS